MTNVEITHLEGLLKKETLSFYDIEQLLSYVLGAFKRKEGGMIGMFNNISTEMQDNIDSACKSVGNLASKLLELYNGITDAQQAAYDDVDAKYTDLWKKYQVLVQKTNDNIKGLDKIVFPDVHIPYNWKELMNMADSLAEMSEEKRKVFYELINTFAKTN